MDALTIVVQQMEPCKVELIVRQFIYAAHVLKAHGVQHPTYNLMGWEYLPHCRPEVVETYINIIEKGV
jgi:hypothetical protein